MIGLRVNNAIGRGAVASERHGRDRGVVDRRHRGRRALGPVRVESSPQDQGGQATKSAKDKPAPSVRKSQVRRQASEQSPVRPIKPSRPRHGRRSRPTRSAAEDEPVKTPLPKRPARSVTPPTLTSAELDRLISKYLDQEQPQGRAGDSDD